MKNQAPLLYNENVIYLMWCNDLKVKWKMNVCVYELGLMSDARNIFRESATTATVNFFLQKSASNF